jgi:hypothetical protein
MGRPLNKKYFGNRNIGTGGNEAGSGGGQNFADDKIGGEGIASINWSTLGSFQGNSNVQVLTALTALPAPTLPGGVQATYTALFEVESVGTGSGKTNLAVGDTFGHASLTGMIAKVTDTSGANAVFSVTTTGASRGNALALADIPKDTVGITLTKIAGSGTASTFLVDIAFRVKESTVTITEKGSGYGGGETFTFTKPGTTSGTVPAGTIVLTTDSGVTNGMNAADNQENAIVAYGWVDGGREVVDVIRQTNGKSYKIEGANGIVRSAKLVTDGDANADGEMDITATDFGGGTYRVAKLSGRKATLVRKGGGSWEFASGASVPCTFTAAPAATALQTGYNVKIDNA